MMQQAAGQDVEARPEALSPLERGVRAAKANVLPAIGLWLAGVALLGGYFYIDAVREVAVAVTGFREAVGWPFAVVSTAIFGGLIPVVVQQFTPRTPNRARLTELPFFLAFWGYKGLEVDLLYRFQAWLFGDDAAVGTVVMKVLVDQGVYVPLWAVPTMVLAYRWREGGYRWGGSERKPARPFASLTTGVGGAGWVGWYRRRCLPLLLANVFVWVPMVVVIYVLPLPLQLPIQNLVLCLFSLLIVFFVGGEEERG